MKICCKQFKFISFVFLQLMTLSSGKSRWNRSDVLCDGKVRTTSFLWRMKRDPPVYFFGTIHVPYTKVWDYIPQNVKKAFREAENVFFELDLTNPNTVSALTRCQMLPRGTDLREVLPSDLYQRLKRHLDYVKSAMPYWVTSEQEGKGLYADYLYDAIVGNWERKKPVWVMLMINSLTEADVRTRGTPVLDLHLARKASMMGKEVGAVERVEEQCQPLNGLNISQVIFALNQTLVNQERLRHGNVRSPYTTDDLIKQYNCGDLDLVMFDKESSQVPQMTNGSFETDETETTNGQNDSDIVMATEIDSYFKNELIYRRNERMAERVKQLLRDNPDRSFFFAFGAGHFLGNGSVIDFLRKDGYEIQHNEPSGNIDSDDVVLKVASNSHLQRRRVKGGGSLTLRNVNKARRRDGGSHRKRNKSRSLQKNKKKQIKGKQRVRDLWTRISSRKTNHKISSRQSENASPHDEVDRIRPHVRVVNRFPTVFPAYNHDDLDPVQGSNKKLDELLKYAWSSHNRQHMGNHRRRIYYPVSYDGSSSEALSMDLWAEHYNDDVGNGGSSLFRGKIWSNKCAHFLFCVIMSMVSIANVNFICGFVTSQNEDAPTSKGCCEDEHVISKPERKLLHELKPRGFGTTSFSNNNAYTNSSTGERTNALLSLILAQLYGNRGFVFSYPELFFFRHILCSR